VDAGAEQAIIRRAFRKRKAGQDLTEEERRALSDQQKAYAGRRTPLYCESPEQLDTWQDMATKAGYTSFSAWIVNQVKHSLSGSVADPQERDRLQRRVQDLQQDLEYNRKKSREWEEDNRILRAEVRRLSAEIAEMAHFLRQKFGTTGKEPKTRRPGG
jgi:hypothetical protein